MKDHVLAAPEIVSKILCYKLSGSYKNGAAIIWISQKDFLIRRVDIDQTIKNIEFHTEYFLFENLLSGTEKVLLNQSCLKGLPSMGVFNNGAYYQLIIFANFLSSSLIGCSL